MAHRRHVPPLGLACPLLHLLMSLYTLLPLLSLLVMMQVYLLETKVKVAHVELPEVGRRVDARPCPGRSVPTFCPRWLTCSVLDGSHVLSAMAHTPTSFLLLALTGVGRLLLAVAGEQHACDCLYSQRVPLGARQRSPCDWTGCVSSRGGGGGGLPLPSPTGDAVILPPPSVT